MAWIPLEHRCAVKTLGPSCAEEVFLDVFDSIVYSVQSGSVISVGSVPEFNGEMIIALYFRSYRALFLFAKLLP